MIKKINYDYYDNSPRNSLVIVEIAVFCTQYVIYLLRFSGVFRGVSSMSGHVKTIRQALTQLFE